MDDFVNRSDVLALLATRKPKVTYRGKFEPSHKSPQSAAVMEERKRLADAVSAIPRADLAQAPAPVRVPQIVIDQLNATVGEVGLEMAQAAEDAEFTGERVDLHDYQVSIPYDHAVAILAALEAPDAGVVAELVEAHRENARVLSHMHNDLQGRVDAPKLAALFECLARSTAALALIAHNTTEG